VGTRLARPGLIRLALIAAQGVVVLTGCTTLTPAQQTQLDDYQQFANRVTRHYGKPDVQIMVGTSNAYGDGVSLMRPDGWMILSPTMLEPVAPGRSRDFGFAHELGHWVTGRFGCGPACEAEANAAAVEILTIGRPDIWTEPKAFRHSMSYLCGTKTRQDAGRPVTKNHVRASQEMEELAARYPQYPALSCS
jgi:hypothetical protein